MWLRGAIIVLLLTGLGAILWMAVPWATIQSWAASEQRGFQNTMAGALRGIQTGDPLAVWTLCLATAAYGFVHALGPGHGKILIGGAALASSATLKRLGLLTLISSLAQSATAIALVGGLYFLLRLGSGDLSTLAEVWLAPLSYAAIAAIGAILVFRGARSWLKAGQKKQSDHACCGHSHGPSVDELKTLSSTRDAAALVASIAVRPCTGALFVLVIAARFDAFAVGCLAVITMGLGTAAFNVAVATSGVAARKLAGLGAHNSDTVQAISATLHMTGGLLIIALSLSMLLA